MVHHMATNSNQDSFSSTLVVGVGGAGSRMLKTVKEMADRQGVSETVELVAIDSKSEDIEANVPEIGPRQRIEFEEPDEYLPDAKARRDYIPEEATLPDEGGATKVRGVGRFYLDDDQNFRTARNKLVAAFERAHMGADYVNVWLLNALGGGTGSGTYPLISALIRFAARESDTEENYRLRGVGTLPRLRIGGTFPDLDFRHHVNAYVALRELRTLLGRHEELDAQQKLQLWDAPQDMIDDYLQVNEAEPLFDEYFLMGFDEEKSSTNYRRRMNEMVADLILYYSLVEGPEDFPERDLPAGMEGDVYSLDSAQTRVPVELVWKYVEKKTKARKKEEKIDGVLSQIDEFERINNFLNSVENVDEGEIPDSPPEDERDRRIAPGFVRECRKVRDEIGNLQDESYLEEQIKQKTKDVVEGSTPGKALRGKFDIEYIDLEIVDDANPGTESVPLSERLGRFTAYDVAGFFIYDQLLEKTKRIRDQRRESFESDVDSLWDKYSDEFEEHYEDQYANYQGADHVTRANGLKAFFDNRIGDLREENESIFKRLGDEIKERKDDRDSLGEGFHKFKSSEKDVQTVRAKRSDARSQIVDARDDFDDARDLLEDFVLDDLEADLDRLERKRDEHYENLSTFSDEDIDTHMPIPLSDLDNLSAKDFAEWVGFERDVDSEWWTDDVLEELKATAADTDSPSIANLESDGFIDQDELKEVVRTILGEMAEPVADREERDVADDLLNKEDALTEPHPLLTILINETNTSDPDWTEIIENIANLNAEFESFADEDVSIRNQHTIKLIGIYSNLNFALTSEYGKVHEYHRQERKTVSEAFFGDGNSVSEIDEHLSFAYPELVVTDDNPTEANIDT